MGPNTQTQGASSKISPSAGSKLRVPETAQILIICEDDLITERLNIVLREAGFISKRAKSITAGCEAAKSGRFQVVISAPVLSDGSWKRLVDVASYYNLGFVVLVMARTCDINEWQDARENGAFDVFDVLHELPKVTEATRRGLWAAYLKGGGPSPDVASSPRAA